MVGLIETARTPFGRAPRQTSGARDRAGQNAIDGAGLRREAQHGTNGIVEQAGAKGDLDEGARAEIALDAQPGLVGGGDEASVLDQNVFFGNEREARSRDRGVHDLRAFRRRRVASGSVAEPRGAFTISRRLFCGAGRAISPGPNRARPRAREGEAARPSRARCRHAREGIVHAAAEPTASTGAEQDSPDKSPESRGPDLAKLPIAELLPTLGVEAAQGLTAAEARKRLRIFGPNALAEKHVFWLRKLLRYFAGPMAYMIEAAALVSAIIGHWGDFAIILALLFFNAGLEAWQDRKASNALAALKKGLAPEATLLRDGAWSAAPASGLVPGDIVKIRLGVVVPADIRLVGGDYVSIDQAALTGESLPVAKKIGDLAYSGSIVKQGEMTGVVIATGAHTFFGRTASLVEGAGAVSHAQKAMFEIGDFLMVVAVALALIMVGVRIYRDLVIVDDWGLKDALSILQFVLVLMVASIPVAMPAVFSITMALGALALSKQKAIVSKLSAIEEMAGVDMLCSDKTGTLTKNQLSVSEPILIAAKDAQDCILAAALASRAEDRDAIDTAVIDALKDKDAVKGYRLDKYTPFDPVTKRTEARPSRRRTARRSSSPRARRRPSFSSPRPRRRSPSA